MRSSKAAALPLLLEPLAYTPASHVRPALYDTAGADVSARMALASRGDGEEGGGGEGGVGVYPLDMMPFAKGRAGCNTVQPQSPLAALQQQQQQHALICGSNSYRRGVRVCACACACACACVCVCVCVCM